VKQRADWKHQWLDPIVVAGPWVAAAGLTFRQARKAVRAFRR